MEITGKTALVTGANRGLGRHLARELRDRGATVYAAARNPASVDLAGVIPIALDVTDPASVAAAAAAHGDVAILVNNAGSSTGASLLTGDLADVRLELDTHFFGTLEVIRAFAPQLAAQQRSAVLNILSVLSWVSFPEQRRLLRGQVGRVVADQRAAPGARPPGHPGQLAARRLHGHRHGQARHARPSPTRPTSPRSRSTASRRATRRSSPTSSAGRCWRASPPAWPPLPPARLTGRPCPRTAAGLRATCRPAAGCRSVRRMVAPPAQPRCPLAGARRGRRGHGPTTHVPNGNRERWPRARRLAGRALRCGSVPAARDSVP